MFEPKIIFKIHDYNADKKLQTVAISGQLDKLGLEKIRKELENFIYETSADIVVFDFQELEFINSESIGFLVGIYSHLKKKNKRFSIVHMNGHIQDVLNTVGLITLFAP